jgi:hypothetical protein
MNSKNLARETNLDQGREGGEAVVEREEKQ